MPTVRFITAPGISESRQIVALYRAEGWWYPDAAPATDMTRLCAIVTGSHCFAVAEDRARIIGMGRAISDRVSDAYIQDVTVAAGHRGKGVGSAILTALVRRLEADGLGWIGLIAERNSQAFYTRLGFSPMTDATPLLKISS